MAIISSTNLKAHLSISDSIDDTVLGYAVNAANAAVVRYCGRTFDTTTTASASARTYRPRRWKLCYTHDFWTTTGLSVKTDADNSGTYETTLTLNTDYLVEPADGIAIDGSTVPYDTLRLLGSATFPMANDRPSVQVTAAWGWAAVPGDVFDATLIKAARLFKRKSSPEGVLGGFADFGAIRVSNREDPDVTALLEPYRTAAARLLVGL